MATKFIFVTGGVVSGLGKGITSAAIGRLLKARGLKVRNQKFDPYINVDPGLMSPTQHGEVFITEDGAETDLDIGHYERFTDENLDIESDITTGMIYRDVIAREREGGYQGTTVQVVPHIINEIKDHLFRLSGPGGPDVVITEIGGTIGDMESQPYLEAIRQASYQVGRENVLFVHVTLIPYLRKAGEIKTKPTQHSVRTLLSLGIQPDILVCRSEVPIDQGVKRKIALYCNVPEECVIENLDVETVYELPIRFEAEGLARVICRKLHIAEQAEPDLRDWAMLVEKFHKAKRKLDVAIVGKYVSLHDAYLSVAEALRHAAIASDVSIGIRYVSSEEIETKGPGALLEQADAIIVPGGFGPRGMDGMVTAARYARERGIPFLGIGLGMQMAVVDAARMGGIANAHSNECESDCTPVFILPKNGTESSVKPMRRGAHDCAVVSGTRLAEIYGRTPVSERHHHRWEFDMQYRPALEKAGMVLSGISPDGQWLEAVELNSHPFFIGVIFHPEFKSRPTRPHPLFTSLITAIVRRKFGDT